MKKVLGFLGSMRFGMLLLILIALFSILGTVIPQGQVFEAYEAAYGRNAHAIMFLGLDHLYSTWYYIALYVLLGVSLTFCSVVRVGRVRRLKGALLSAAEKAEPLEGFSAADPEAVLKKKGFRRAGEGWLRNGLGLYGSFVTHLSMLLMLIACACVFMLEAKTDYSLMVGDAVALEDGTVLKVDAFSMETEGKTDYVSDLTATLPDGTEKSGTIRVNQPVKFGRYKVYQQSYNYAGQLDLRTEEDGEDERATLDGPAFISLDGENGVSYMGSFGTYTRAADGRVLPPGYDDEGGEPVDAYMIAVIDGDSQEARLQPVDETFEVGGVYFTFRAPAAYPGLRVKTVPGFVMPALYATFVLLLAGLYLCFFHVPAAAYVRGSGVALKSFKDIEALEDAIREESEPGASN